MKKKLIKRILLLIAIVIASLALLAVIVPLFISPAPLEDVVSAEEVQRNDSRFVTIPFQGTDSIEIHYREKGGADKDEPVFVLLHGSMYNLYSWDRVMDFFGSMGRVIANDQVPYGLSEKMISGDWTGANPYTQEAAVDQLAALLDEFDLDQVYLVGSSYGGTLAVRTALEHEERVAGMILVDAAVFVSETMPEWLLESRQMENIGPLMSRMMGNNVPFYESCYADPAFFNGKRKEDTMILTKVENWDAALWQYLKGTGDRGTLIRTLKELPFVETLEAIGDMVQIGVDSGNRRLAEVVEKAFGCGYRIEDITLSKPTLEDVFLKHTGRHLRD